MWWSNSLYIYLSEFINLNRNYHKKKVRAISHSVCVCVHFYLKQFFGIITLLNATAPLFHLQQRTQYNIIWLGRTREYPVCWGNLLCTRMVIFIVWICAFAMRSRQVFAFSGCRCATNNSHSRLHLWKIVFPLFAIYSSLMYIYKYEYGEVVLWIVLNI